MHATEWYTRTSSQQLLRYHTGELTKNHPIRTPVATKAAGTVAWLVSASSTEPYIRECES